jgi:hypothetical protein
VNNCNSILSQEKQMLAKLLSLALASLLTITISLVPVSAQTQSQPTADSAHADQVKAKVTRLGTGKQARVSVRFRDSSKLKGYIGEIGTTHFTLIDPSRGTVTPIPYDQVQAIKNTNHSAVTAALLGAGTIVGVMLLVVLSLRGS